MIKTNLLKNLSQDHVTQLTSTGAVVTDDSRKSGILKIVLVFIPLIALLVKEQIDQKELTQKSKALQAQLERVNKEKIELGELTKKVELASKKKEAIMAQMTSVQKIARRRLTEIKLLDLIQSNIPNSVWVSEIKVEAPSVVISAIANNESGPGDFVALLKGSPFFSGVDLLGVNSDKPGVKKFSIKLVLASEQGAGSEESRGTNRNMVQ